MRTAEEILQEKERDIITVNSGATILDAINVMNENKIGAILVKKDEKIRGIFTERDLLKTITKEGFDPKTALIDDYCSTVLKSAPHSATVDNLLDSFLGMRLRHLLIEKDGNYIGMLSTGDVVRASLIEKSEELDKLNAKFNWDYYEDWKWKKKK